jgi:TonB family protein
MGGNTPRLGFLASVVVHLFIVMLLIEHRPTILRPIPASRPAEPPAGPAVFLPPADVLRQLRPVPPARPAPPPVPPARALTAPIPTPPPTPPPALRDRVSIGRAERAQTKGPIELRPGQDLAAVQKGRPDGVGGGGSAPAAAGGPREAPRPVPGGQLTEAPVSEAAKTGSGRPSLLAETLRNLDQRLAAGAARGVTSGTLQELGPLTFDPQGADFTKWATRMQNEFYRNWIVPQAVLLGFHGRVDMQFTVERDGRISELLIIKSSGMPALDRASANALLGSRLSPLPADYAPPTLTINVYVTYNERPAGS